MIELKIHVEVYIASRILGNNRSSFITEDLIGFIQKDFGCNRPSVMTYVTAVCIANEPVNHALGNNFLWRIGHGDFWIYQPGIDRSVSERVKHRQQPRIEDVPEKYRFLLKRQDTLDFQMFYG